MHYPNPAGCRLKRLRIEIHRDTSEYLKELVWGQLTTGVNHITDSTSSFPYSFHHLLCLSSANLIGDFCKLLLESLEVKPFHFLAIQDELRRGELVVDGVL